MKIKTVTTKSGINQVEFSNTDDRYYWIKNKGDNSILVSTEHPDTLAEGEGITEVEPGEITLVENYGNIIYINGESEVEIREQDIPMCPFKASQKGGDMVVESDIFTVSAEGNPVKFNGLQGGVPFTEVTLSGKNLYTANLIVGGIDPTNGELLTGVTNCLCTDDFVAVEGDKYYEFYHAEDIEGIHVNAIFFYDADKKYIDCWQGETDFFDTPENCYYIKWQYPVNSPASVDMITDVTLVAGRSNDEYVPPITGQEMTITVNDTAYTITPDSNPYTVPTEIYQHDGVNTVYVTGEGEPTLLVKGIMTVNAALKIIWDKFKTLENEMTGG